jgi:hypothetical protein
MEEGRRVAVASSAFFQTFCLGRTWRLQWFFTCKSFFFSVALQSLKDLGRLTYRWFLELFRHMVGLLGRVINPSQGLYLHRTTQHRKTRTDIHALSGDSNPRSQQPTGQDPRLRPHGHCDRRKSCLLAGILILCRCQKYVEFIYYKVGLTASYRTARRWRIQYLLHVYQV